MALLILALLQRIFLMSSLMLLLVWLIFFMVLIKLLPILGTISGKTVKLMVLALICLGNNRQDLFLLVLILLLMPTLNFLPVWFALSLLRFRLPSRLPMMFILWMVAMMVVIIPSRTV